MRGPRLSLVLAVCQCALMALAGCSVTRWASREESEQRAAQLKEVQLKVMRHADEYAGRIKDPLEALNRQTSSPEERLAAQNWRISQASAAYTIASGPNPTINALDMIVLATLSRGVVEDHWLSEYGERARALLDAHRELERQSWTLVEGLINSEQIDQVRALIERWRAEHATERAVALIRFDNFAAIMNRPGTEAHGGGSLFSIIGLDPLSNLDPAVREIEQTRQLAERTIYYLQRAPSLLDMQVERLTYQLALMPEAQRTLAGVDSLSGAAEAFGKLSADAPAILARERHALVVDLTATLHSEQARMQELLVEMRDVLNAGTQTSASLTGTITALDAFVARFQPKDLQPPVAAAPRRPFDINDYATTARELAGAAAGVQQLLVQLDASSAGVERLAQSATQDLHEVVDHAFRRGIVLIAVLGLVALLVALLYRIGRAALQPLLRMA